MKEIFSASRGKMQKAIDTLEHNLSVLRTGRANAGMLNKVQIDYYGSMMGISSVANVTVPDSRTLVIQAYERNMLAPIEKAIRDSDLGLNPSNRGDALYVSIPPLTEERRKDLVKNAKVYAEEARVAVRNVRQDAMKQIKTMEKDKLATSDDVKRGEAEVQKLTDEFIKSIDTTFERKEQEILN
jgi:ribosome recycling factor